MASFADLHAEWQQAKEVAARTGTAAAKAEAERLRLALTMSPAVQSARQHLDARPAGAPLGERVKARRRGK